LPEAVDLPREAKRHEVPERACCPLIGDLLADPGQAVRQADRISKELWAKRTMVFTFLRKPEVVWHNNLAENHVQQGVLYRKISGG